MKKSISLILLLCMVLSGCGKSSTDASSEEVVLADNQSLKYGQVTTINGNEITIALANEVSSSDIQSQRGNRGQSTADPSATGEAGKEQGGSGGNPPSGDGSTGQAPGSDQADGQTPPDMNGGSSQGAMPGTDSSTDSKSSAADSASSSSKNKQNKPDKSNSSSDESTQSKVMYQLTGEEETLTIPVGTTVTTSLGTKTTFSRIAVDDTLKLLMEKNDAGEDVIVGVWIVA